jgi:hypothetical protein
MFVNWMQIEMGKAFLKPIKVDHKFIYLFIFYIVETCLKIFLISNSRYIPQSFKIFMKSIAC